jgi:hypothetical protein
MLEKLDSSVFSLKKLMFISKIKNAWPQGQAFLIFYEKRINYCLKK